MLNRLGGTCRLLVVEVLLGLRRADCEPASPAPCGWDDCRRPVPACFARHGRHLQRLQFRRGGVRASAAAVDRTSFTSGPVLAGLLGDGSEVLQLHRVLVGLAGAELVLRPPGGGIDEIVEPDLARGGVGLLDHDDGVAARSGWMPAAKLVELALAQTRPSPDWPDLLLKARPVPWPVSNRFSMMYLDRAMADSLLSMPFSVGLGRADGGEVLHLAQEQSCSLAVVARMSASSLSLVESGAASSSSWSLRTSSRVSSMSGRVRNRVVSTRMPSAPRCRASC